MVALEGQGQPQVPACLPVWKPPYHFASLLEQISEWHDGHIQYALRSLAYHLALWGHLLQYSWRPLHVLHLGELLLEDSYVVHLWKPHLHRDLQ